MIEGNELRVGNYVVYEREIMTVGEIFQVEKADYDSSGIGVHLLHLNGNRYDLELGRSPGDFDALPINSEYLSATGFKRITQTVYSLNGFTVILEDGIHLLYGGKHVQETNGFHQLQNEYYNFTGSELPHNIK